MSNLQKIFQRHLGVTVQSALIEEEQEDEIQNFQDKSIWLKLNYQFAEVARDQCSPNERKL